ncbi:Tautomerase/MIF [Nemania sp. FL0916]|nr:Tautomerase/MIF [Nemania sp. FL0916]
MPEDLVRRSANTSPPSAAGIRRPDSPVVKPQQVGSSFAQRKSHRQRPSNAVLVEGNNVMRSIDRPLPGDVIGRRKSQVHPDLCKKRSAYFESEFAVPSKSDDPAKIRILSEVMVTAELRTNVIISDEFAFITDLAYHLSNRYQRPVSSIVVTLHHGICVLFGSTFEPAYTLAIHALPSLLQPATNRRNATLIQQHLHETLGVVSARGYIRFEGTPEENVAIGGRTIAAEIDSLSKDNTDRKPGVFRKPSKSSRGIMKSVKSLGNFKLQSVIDLSENVPTPPPSNSGETTRIATIPEVPPTPPDDERTSQLEERKTSKRASHRKSLRFALFGNKTPLEK